MNEKIVAAAAIILAAAATWFALKPETVETAPHPADSRVMASRGDGADGQPGEAASPAQARYTEGLKYFQAADYEKARAEWEEALRLDPGNQDAAAGLDRIKKITAK